MTAFSTPLAGGMAGGLNALSSPLGGTLPAPLLAQLLGRAGVGGMPGSLAPQIPMLPGAPRGAAGPVPPISPAPQPAPTNLMASIGALGGGGLNKVLGGNGGARNASQGFFGSNVPLFGVDGLFGYGPLFNAFAGTDAASVGYPALLGGSTAAAGALPEGMSLADMLRAGLIAM